jgi:hypothetical protein
MIESGSEWGEVDLTIARGGEGIVVVSQGSKGTRLRPRKVIGGESSLHPGSNITLASACNRDTLAAMQTPIMVSPYLWGKENKGLARLRGRVSLKCRRCS